MSSSELAREMTKDMADILIKFNDPEERRKKLLQKQREQIAEEKQDYGI